VTELDCLVRESELAEGMIKPGIAGQEQSWLFLHYQDKAVSSTAEKEQLG
jgi:hypothetical protein